MIISNHEFINLIIWLLSLWIIPPMYSSLQMLASRTTLLLPYLISTFGMYPSSKLSIILLTLWVLKLNYSPLDAVLTRLPIPLASLKSLLSWIQFMLYGRSSMWYHISFKFIWLLSLENFVSFSLIVKIIRLNSRNVLADIIGLSTKWLIKRPSCSILSPYSLANCLGIIVRRTNVMTSPIDRKWSSKYQMQKENNSWISLTVMTTSLNHHTSNVVYGSDILVTLTLCAQELWEQLLITLQLVNIG